MKSYQNRENSEKAVCNTAMEYEPMSAI